MSLPIREVSPRAKKRILLLHVSGPAVVLVMFWAAFVAEAAFHVDLLAKFSGKKSIEGAGTIYLAFAVLSTVLGPLFAWLQIRKALMLAESGVEVIGCVTKVGKLTNSGMVKAVCQYSHDSKTYSYAWSHSTEQPILVGEPIELLIDPAKPKRCMRKAEVL